MSDSIREQIIQNVVTKLADITTTNGYNTNIGNTVDRARAKFDLVELPAVSVFPMAETAMKIYGKLICEMPILVEGVLLFGATNHSIMIERILGDSIACLTGLERELNFTSGGTYEIAPGDVITGAISTETAKVIEVTVATGSWAGGDAAGTLRVRLQSGSFTSENLDVGANSNVATISGNSTPIAKLGGLVNEIVYVSGGPESYPNAGDLVAGCPVTFNIKYNTLVGNPNSQ